MRVAFAADALADESVWLEVFRILAKVDDGWHLWECTDAAAVERSPFLARAPGTVAELDRMIVLRTVLAMLGEDIYRTDWTRLAQQTRQEHAEQLPRAVERAKDAWPRAAAFLAEVHVHSDRLLPYAMQAAALTVFFDACPTPTPEQHDLLRRWFWVTSFTAWFGRSNSSRVRDFVKEFGELAHKAALGEPLDGAPLRTVDLSEPAAAFPKSFDFRSARARALLLVLLAQNPRTDAGDVVEEPWSLIASEGPAAVGKVFATVTDPELASSPANRILRWKPRDRSQAKHWLLNASDEVLTSHAIPPDALPFLEQGDHEAFLRRRLAYLIDLERRFMEAHGVTPPVEHEPEPAPIDTDE